MYHIHEVFGVTVDMIRDSSSFPSSSKSVVGAAAGDVVASNTVFAALTKKQIIINGKHLLASWGKKERKNTSE